MPRIAGCSTALSSEGANHKFSGMTEKFTGLADLLSLGFGVKNEKIEE